MENVIVLSKTGRLNSRMRRYMERGDLITHHRLEEHIRQSEIKALENIIDQAFGVETSPRKVLTLKRKSQNDSANVIASLITQVKGDETQDPTPSFDNCCMSDVALYSTTTPSRRRLESGEVTARV
ncbi:conserved protein of unknown function [Xenorhabdus poinarii G6]|uniref:Uncharacterized protein n=1 Tax=Xenorhabdus poinarii G6 TaxID=1354304 RepID=A0A068R4H7_9GAMM|nr:hypothetical protein [Xenorhabdus poinarii]CDG21030.1 conserved protein of unknown function [Xenorhabdus poinarii G6]